MFSIIIIEVQFFLYIEKSLNLHANIILSIKTTQLVPCNVGLKDQCYLIFSTHLMSNKTAV